VKNQTANEVESDLLSPKMNRIKRSFFICLLIILPLAIMELLSFIYIKLTSEKGTFRDRVSHVDNPYHPYFGYVHAPNSTYNISKATSGEGTLVTDENGYSVTPAGLIKRLIGGTPLPTRPNDKISSYWVARLEPAQPKGRFLKRY
jgi:hypothetical protein